MTLSQENREQSAFVPSGLLNSASFNRLFLESQPIQIVSNEELYSIPSFLQIHSQLKVMESYDNSYRFDIQQNGAVNYINK